MRTNLKGGSELRNQEIQKIIEQKIWDGMQMNTFQKQEERKNKLKDLIGKYAYEALLRLAADLKIDAESLLRIMAGVQGIDSALGKKIY